MAVRNGAAYIEQALAGLAGQSRGDFTLLVADNASTDATPDILA
ncbi:MAG: glycosyltransferase, partial [Alphaproteobacteria bacterium]